MINSVTKGGEGDNLDVLLIGEEGGKILLKLVTLLVELDSSCEA